MKKAHKKKGIWMYGRPEEDMRMFDTYALRSDYLFCNWSRIKFFKEYTWVGMRKYSWSSYTPDDFDFFDGCGSS